MNVNSILTKTSTFVTGYGSRDAFFRTIQSFAKLLALLQRADESTKRRVLLRIASLLGTSRKYFAIGNCIKEIYSLKTCIESSTENPEYILRCLKSGGMLGFFTCDNINACSSLVSGNQSKVLSTIGNLSFLVSVVSAIGIEYLNVKKEEKEEKEDVAKKYVRYGRIASDLIIVLNGLGVIKLPEELSTLAGLISAGLCCVEHFQ